MPVHFEQPQLDPEKLNYSVDLGVVFEMHVECEKLGMQQIGIIATGIHKLVCDVVYNILNETKEAESHLGEIPREHLVLLEIIETKTGSWWTKFKPKIPEQFTEIAIVSGKKIKVGLEIIADLITVAALMGLPTTCSVPPKDSCVSPDTRNMIEELSRHGQFTLAMRIKYNGEEHWCEIKTKHSVEKRKK